MSRARLSAENKHTVAFDRSELTQQPDAASSTLGRAISTARIIITNATKSPAQLASIHHAIGQ